MGGLILAGEAIFGLPFHVARFFRPTMLAAFRLTNVQLGSAQAAYGVLGMISYVPGGLLADRFSVRGLLAISLLSTSAGGLYMASMPSINGLRVLHAFWGITTILLFWAALIRATREWGGKEEQGRAFGILEGGRGFVAAAISTVVVLLIGFFLPADPTMASDAQRVSALQGVIFVYTGITFFTGLLVWFLVPKAPVVTVEARSEQSRRDILEVLRSPTVWLQALIIICAYVGYKGLDNYSLFAVEGCGMNEIEGARLSTIAAWVRPFSAVIVGLLGDRFSASKAVMVSFGLMALGNLFFALNIPSMGGSWVLYANVVATSGAIFGLRGVYFALFEEATLPPHLTGSATGLVSLVGYVPDIFVSVMAGWLLDRSPGLAGHQHLFGVMAGFALLGLMTALLFDRINRQRRTDVQLMPL